MATVLPLSFLLLALGAVAGPTGYEAVTAARLACEAEAAWLDSRLEGGRVDLDAQLRRGVCRLQLGRYDLALQDLGSGLGGRGPAAVAEALVAAGYPADAASARAVDAAVAHAIVLVNRGRLVEAKAARDRLAATGGAALARVDAALQSAYGDQAGAWRVVEDAVARWPGDAHTALAAAEIAVNGREGRPASVTAYMTPQATAGTLTNDAVRASNAGDARGCLAAVDSALAQAFERDRPTLERLAYTCAVGAGDLARAETALARGDWATPPPFDVRLRHVALLAQAGRALDALDALDALEPSTPEDQAARDDARIDVHMAAGDLDSAKIVAMQGIASPDERGRVAVALHNAGRTGEAVAVLDRTCPQMTGTARDHCLSVRQTLADWLAQTGG